MLLDSEYVASTGSDETKLSADQRKEACQRVIVLAGVLAVLLLSISVAVLHDLDFSADQSGLRVEMLSRVERLSLRFHSDSKTGDAIYDLPRQCHHR